MPENPKRFNKEDALGMIRELVEERARKRKGEGLGNRELVNRMG